MAWKFSSQGAGSSRSKISASIHSARTLRAVGHAAMGQGLGDRLVGVFQLGVLADDGDADLTLRVGHAVHHVFPFRQVRLRGRGDAESVEDGLVEARAMVGEGGFVDRLQVIGRDDRGFPDVAEEGDLFQLTLGDRVFGAADEDIGGKADGFAVP